VGLVIGVGLWLGLTVADGSAGPRMAASFTLPRLGGGPLVSMPIAHRPRTPVVITFFASWCTPCQTELPMVANVARHELAKGGWVTFIGIDGNDDPSSGLAFARASGVAFPVGADHESAVAPSYLLIGYPDTVFVDRTGHVAGTVQGPVSRTVLQNWLARLTG
jgi:cytochrome c biogenesis protein CcmG/thiol:disulfide interchange protein DsbE